ncbi:MAG: secondary thiamine-phosphate synthase enzyme YjbQ [Candidatus Omnitrophica bacterium]|nr:secondary thiamine-phosphate synthase enzyme YjbQ [Candidatus Omnitrophota bacterium]MDD5670067.1 secondary thiamine-phosphate synthase enzyme YjbQ [Candidatus Omnitrophota bacterium]
MIQEFKVESSRREELIDITDQVQRAVQGLKGKDGACIVFTPHTTAAITVNENADPDVVRDILYGFGKMVPETGYHHREGNSPAHIKSSLVGCSEQILVANGKLVLGTWQGIYFCEFDGPRQRSVLVKMI